MKKIVFAITKGNFGGAQRYVYDIATNLPRDSYSITVIIGRGGTLQKKLSEKNIKTRSIASLERDISTAKEIASFIELFKTIRKERPDILHLNSSKMGLFGGLCGRLLRIQKIIFTAHGWAHVEERPLIIRVAIKLLHIMTVVLSHKTIAVSEEVKNQMNTFLTKNKVCVIHNGIKTVHALPRNDARRALNKYCNTPLKDTDFIVGTISELHTNKGLPYAISAFQNIQNAKFLILGDGEEELNLKALVADYNLEEKVIFCGFVPDAHNLVKAFDVFLLSSVKEGFPYVLLEAGKEEIPIVATRVGGIPELIINGETGLLIERRNPDAIIHAVQKLQEKRDLQLQLGKRVAKKVADEFTLETMLTKTRNVYELEVR